jgi:hypothetical protein
MPQQERFTRKQAGSKRRKPPKPDAETEQNGHRNGGSSYEQALAEYLEERIKPGLNRGAIPMLTRSIARDIANGGNERKLADYLQERIRPGLNSGAIPLLARSIAHDLLTGAANGAAERKKDRQPQRDRDDEQRSDDEGESEGGIDFEAEMHDLQAELGEDWILRFSVWNGDAWLTAEKADGTQHVEAPAAAAIVKAVKLLNRRGGRSSD